MGKRCAPHSRSGIGQGVVRFVQRVIRGMGARLLRLVPPADPLANLTKVTDRHWEYPFALESVLRRHTDARERIAVDAGCTGSILPGILCALGYTVVGLDLNAWHATFAGFRMVVSDLTNIPLRARSCDVVTVISTIEHCGLGRYGDERSQGADKTAMGEIRRILKDDGFVILSVPFGRPFIYGEKHRVYDDAQFAQLTQGWRIVEQRFFGPTRRARVFAPIPRDEAFAIDPAQGPYCITITVLVKA